MAAIAPHILTAAGIGPCPFIPAELAALAQWLAWRFEGGGPKPRKVPYYANGRIRQGAQGSDADRAALVTAAEAWDACQRHRMDGIGFAFLPDDGLIGIDLDDKIDPATGEVDPEALAIIARAATYCETSPSRTGFHLIGRGTCDTFKDNGIGLEVFCGRQFFTWTGNTWGDSSGVNPLPDDLLRDLRARVDAAKAADKPAPKPASHAGGENRANAYGRGALDDACAKVASASDGTRNDTLNAQALGIARLVAGGAIGEREAWERLSGAASACGLDAREAEATLRSAFRAGKEQPRTAPESSRTAADVPPEAWPAPIPLPDGLLSVPSFPDDLLPERLRPWVTDIAERVQCAPEFVAVPAMVALGSLIGRRVGIRPQARTDWTETPNLWGCIVGRPGVLKSPAMSAALAPIERLAAKARAEHAERATQDAAEAEARELRAALSKAEAKKRMTRDRFADVSDLLRPQDAIATPPARRYSTNDTSYQALAELLIQNPNGLLVVRDELVSLLAALDAEENAEARGFYLTGWNGSQGYTVDRIGRGLGRHVDAVTLSLIGGTQPGKLASYINAANRGGAGDDGLIQRFGLLVWPDLSGEWRNVDRWPDHQAKRDAFEVFERLDGLTPEAIGAEQDTDHAGEPAGLPFLRFAPDALEEFTAWRTVLEGPTLRGGDTPPALESHFAKYRKHVPALALICHLADGGAGPVSLEATLRAIAWADYLAPHARRAFGSGPALAVQAARAILKRIRARALPDTFTARDVYRPQWSGLTDRDTVREALLLLEDHNYIASERQATGGAPATVYRVNPRAHE